MTPPVLTTGLRYLVTTSWGLCIDGMCDGTEVAIRSGKRVTVYCIRGYGKSGVFKPWFPAVDEVKLGDAQEVERDEEFDRGLAEMVSPAKARVFRIGDE